MYFWWILIKEIYLYAMLLFTRYIYLNVVYNLWIETHMTWTDGHYVIQLLKMSWLCLLWKNPRFQRV